MKKITSIFLAICMLLCAFALTGCTNTDTAALKEEYSAGQYEWEDLFSANGDGERLIISRRHYTWLIFHSTYFKITVYKDGYCTYFYETTAVPCKNGFWFCNNKYADIKDACAIDGIVAALYPYVETVHANRILEDIITGKYTGEGMERELFVNMASDYLTTDFQEDVVTGSTSSGIGIGASYNDYLSKAVEIVFGVEDAKSHWDATCDAEEAGDYARLIMPWLSEIERGTKTSVDKISFELAKALNLLDELSGRYELGKLKMDNYSASFAAVEQELIDNFKAAMDDIDLQKAAEAEKNAKKFEQWLEDFFSF